MPQLSQTEANWRSPRLQFAHTTPAVLRVQSGHRFRGKLRVISVTGGLLCLPSPLDQRSHVKLMFLTDVGTVVGIAEMLPPVSAILQPFRFVKIDEDDERRLREIIQLSVDQNRLEQRSIVKDRTW